MYVYNMGREEIKVDAYIVNVSQMWTLTRTKERKIVFLKLIILYKFNVKFSISSPFMIKQENYATL